MAMMTSICFRANSGVPSASFSLLAGPKPRFSGVSVTTAAKASSSSGLLHSSFVPPATSLSFSSGSAFAGNLYNF